jgi:hypothetical protein
MKKFESYDEVSGMRSCMKRPVIVHAKQMHEEFIINTLEGEDHYGKAGDYLMRDVYGELYVYDKDLFEKLYDFTDTNKEAWTPWGQL